jgi:hypothetical protein
MVRLALQLFAPGVLCPAVLVLLSTASIAAADVQGLVPIIASASVVASDDSVAGPCRSLECVRGRVHASTTVRLAGEFGRFTGHVTRWDADSLTAFEVDPDWGGSAPASPVAWSQISRVDQRVSNSPRAAVFGGITWGITLGGITAVLAATITAAGNPDAHGEINQAALKGALIGGALGAGIGAGINAGSNRWIMIYRR